MWTVWAPNQRPRFVGISSSGPKCSCYDFGCSYFGSLSPVLVPPSPSIDACWLQLGVVHSLEVGLVPNCRWVGGRCDCWDEARILGHSHHSHQLQTTLPIFPPSNIHHHQNHINQEWAQLSILLTGDLFKLAELSSSTRVLMLASSPLLSRSLITREWVLVDEEALIGDAITYDSLSSMKN